MSLPSSRQKREGAAFFVAFILTIPLANVMIGSFGAVCPPDGPCLIPVAPGLMAPSGVLMIGTALTLRDLVQRRLGLAWSVAAILIGGVLSGFVAPPALVIASVAAFLFSEAADLAVLTPLQRRDLVLAVLLSSLVGIAVDSAIFLLLAFGDLAHLRARRSERAGWSLVALPFIHALRRRDARLGLEPTGAFA